MQPFIGTGRPVPGAGPAPPGAARTPASILPWMTLALFDRPRGLAGLPPRLRPLGSRRPHAGPIGETTAERSGPRKPYLRIEVAPRWRTAKRKDRRENPDGLSFVVGRC